MQRINFARDIQPLSAFRKEASTFIDRLRETRRPLVLTRNGRTAAVVLDAEEFERLLDRLEILEDVHSAREQARKGETLPHRQAIAHLKSRRDGSGDTEK